MAKLANCVLPKSRILIHILYLYVNIHIIFKSSIYYVNISVTVGVVKNIFIPKLLQDFDINFGSSNICCSLFESRLVAVVAGASIKDSLAIEKLLSVIIRTRIKNLQHGRSFSCSY